VPRAAITGTVPSRFEHELNDPRRSRRERRRFARPFPRHEEMNDSLDLAFGEND
jgi:hypothetical protein